MSLWYTIRTQSSLIVLSLGAIILASYLKINFMIGSQTAFFSGNAIAFPLVGLVGGSSLSFFVYLMRIGMRVFTQQGIISYAVQHVPGLCAAFSWSGNAAFFHVLLPLFCMGLFITHPEASQAWPYALYWLIPVMIYLSSFRNFFMRALAATFIAHAVGSIIWLYTVPMTAALWLGLIPIVAVERLLMATSMVFVYGLIEKAVKISSVVMQRLKHSKGIHTA